MTDFFKLAGMFQQMREAEWKRFASDPNNAEILRIYDRLGNRLRLCVLAALVALFATSITAGLLLAVR